MRKILSFILAGLILALVSGCNPVDDNYGVKSDVASDTSSVAKISEDVEHPEIMSDDKVMPQFVDISVFDEENYSAIYLGKRFKFKIEYAGDEFTVPSTLKKLEKNGWSFATGSIYNKDSICYAGDSVDAYFVNENGDKIKALFFNSSNSSVSLSECNIVKFKIENNFYNSPDNYCRFNVNGVNNAMAITDIVDTLGTPSHFYGISENDYYLDYFISEKDRRNGITVYINPTDDMISAIEFSYYK